MITEEIAPGQQEPATLHPVTVNVRRGGQLAVRDAGAKAPIASSGSDPYKRVQGEHYPMVTAPVFTDVEGDVVMASDGTVSAGRGGAAYIVNSGVIPGTLKSVLPVDGTTRHTTSYRTELFGMLGALLTLRMLLQEQQQQWRHLDGTLWCDNEAAVKAYNELEDTVPFSLKMANQSDADVLQELRVIKSTLPIEVCAAWVKSHQTSGKTREARLNNIVDRLAGQQHNKGGKWATSKKSKMLPHTQAQLLINGERYTGPINVRIQHQMYQAKARKYVIDKMNLQRSSHLVDWEALGALHRRLSWTRKATRIKFLFLRI